MQRDSADEFRITLLALAANTSFGGLPVLASLLARDDLAPHVFGLRADRPVYRYGVVVLAVLAGLLLIAVDANTNALIPLYAIGVFTGFTLAQGGLVRHWAAARPKGWQARAALNGTGAVMTAVATGIFLVTKFTAGAWVVVIAIPGLILLFSRISRYYAEVGEEMSLGSSAAKPGIGKSLVVVTVTGVTKMTQTSLSAALSLGDEVVAVSVQFDRDRAVALRSQWDRWDPGVDLVILKAATHSVTAPMLSFLGSPKIRDHSQVMVLIPELEPRKRRHRVLQNQRDILLANMLRQRTDVIVARVPFRLHGD